MSALHRSMLKRRGPEPLAPEDAECADAYIRSTSWTGVSSTSPPAAASSVGQSDASPGVPSSRGGPPPSVHPEGVEPEVGDEGAVLVDSVDSADPGTPNLRATAHACQAAATAPPAADASGESLQEMLHQRLAAMFLRGPGAPRPSGILEPVADKPYLWLLVAVEKAAANFWKCNEAHTRDCCQPSLISETDLRGYLVNDALGHPLLPAGYGEQCPDAVGKRVHNGVVKAGKDEKAARKTAREAARKVARRGGAVDADAEDKAAQAALAAPYNLKLPGSARGHVRKTPAIMSPQELSMAGVKQPSELEKLAAARAQLAAAEAEATAMEAATAAALAVVQRHLRFLETLPEDEEESVRERALDEAYSASEKLQTLSAAAHTIDDEIDAAAAEVAAMQRKVARAGAGAADAVAASDDGASLASDDVEWEWEEHHSQFELYRESDLIVAAVSLTAAGLARCVECAHRLVRAASRSTARGLEPTYPFPPGYITAWQQSVPFHDICISAQQLQDAVKAELRCAHCESDRVGVLTAAGAVAMTEAASAAAMASGIAWQQHEAARLRDPQSDGSSDAHGACPLPEHAYNYA